MKKFTLFWIFGVSILVIVGFVSLFFLYTHSNSTINENNGSPGIFLGQQENSSYGNSSIQQDSESSTTLNYSIHCGDYDDNEAQCSSHPECVWDDGCDPTQEQCLVPALEEIGVSDTLPNSICKELPLADGLSCGERYYCLAVVNNNPQFCEGIDEPDQKDICLAHANTDSSYCKNLDGEELKHNCYYRLAVASENADFCSEIDYDQNEKEQCYFNFMSNLYQWGKSDEIKTEYCNQLSSPDDNTCLALKARDISKCGSNENCLTFFEQPLSFCDDFPDFVSCIKDRAKISRNISICDLLPGEDRDSCIGVYCTHIELDKTVCDKIESLNKKQEVYIELAIFLKNLG